MDTHDGWKKMISTDTKKMAALIPDFRRFRFNVRSLLLALIVICGLLGWLGLRLQSIERQRIAAEWWEQHGAYVSSEYGQVTSIQPYGARISAEDFSKLEKFPHLKMLFLQDLAVEDSAIARIGQLRTLEWLVLTDRHITDEALKSISNLHNLRNLFLGGTQITDKGAAQLSELKRLEYLNLERTKVSERVIAELRRALPDAKIDY
jgi:hypothetical protein